MLADRGPPKKRLKKSAPVATPASTETSIVPVVVVPTRMIFSEIPTPAQATSTSTAKSAASTASSMRSATGSNNVYPIPISMLWLGEEMPGEELPEIEAAKTKEAKKGKAKGTTKKKSKTTNVVAPSDSPAMGTRRKIGNVTASPDSPAMGTRSKRKLNIS
ncbi:hypothetical protein BS78_06G110900 [Paspalum vaginatum]|nr:hypothetical protein BS78_06G110900 [Paspalum vaginatum]